MTARRRSAGFTLLETLVAVTLLALLFGALMPVFQQGLTVLRVSDRHARAVLLAQSLLQREASSVPPQGDAEAGGEDSGALGDFEWQILREPHAADDSGPTLTGEGPFVLVKVTAVVTWPGNANGVRLATLGIEKAAR